MALFPMQNNSKIRKAFTIANVDYYLDPGYGGFADTTAQQVTGLYPLTPTGNTTMQALASMLASLQTNLTVGSKNIATAQVTINSDKPYLVAAARTSRIAITIMNTSSTDIYIGDETVTSNSGIALIGIAGNEITIPTQDDIFAISASGNVTVGILETF